MKNIVKDLIAYLFLGDYRPEYDRRSSVHSITKSKLKTTRPKVENVSIDDPRLLTHLDNNVETLTNAVLLLGLCHTALVEDVNNEDGSTDFKYCVRIKKRNQNEFTFSSFKPETSQFSISSKNSFFPIFCYI